jgi:hypothetical protein
MRKFLFAAALCIMLAGGSGCVKSAQCVCRLSCDLFGPTSAEISNGEIPAKTIGPEVDNAFALANFIEHELRWAKHHHNR